MPRAPPLVLCRPRRFSAEILIQSRLRNRLQCLPQVAQDLYLGCSNERYKCPVTVILPGGRERCLGCHSLGQQNVDTADVPFILHYGGISHPVQPKLSVSWQGIIVAALTRRHLRHRYPRHPKQKKKKEAGFSMPICVWERSFYKGAPPLHGPHESYTIGMKKKNQIGWYENIGTHAI